MTDKIPIRDAMKDPVERDAIEEMVGRIRGALAPMLHADLENLPHNQSRMITAAALHAGMTIGHMVAVGAMNHGDKARAVKAATVTIQSGIKIGLHEARQAMLEQSPVEGQA